MQTMSTEMANLLKSGKMIGENRPAVEVILGQTRPPADPNAIKVYTATDLYNVRNNLFASYVQMNDIDLTDYSNWEPIGDTVNSFCGIYDGQNYKITNLKINKTYNLPGGVRGIGLFGATYYDDYAENYKMSELKNINIVDAVVIANGTQPYHGILVGSARDCYINNCHTSGSITYTSYNSNTGGLCGYFYIWPFHTTPYLINCSSTATVTSLEGDSVGGLIGELEDLIEKCYSTGNVIGKTEVGGLIGMYNMIDDGQPLKNCYAIGNVTGDSNVGGLVGSSTYGEIINSYSIGEVNGISGLGGLVGEIDEEWTQFTSCYYDTETSGQVDIGKGTPLSTINMKTQTSFIDWDFNNIWEINPSKNNGYPIFKQIIDNIIVPKLIQISRSKGMAGQLTVEFDNKDAILAPDGTTNPALLWPNKEITVKQGYGTELIQTFNGLIDTISMSTFPQSISISVRDKMKALLDHLARDSSFSYVLTYTGQTVEAIWQDLIAKAGLAYGTVQTTGITLTEKIFSWQTYADCISWLDEIAGFETYCDEFGVMHFVYDGRPVDATVAYEFDEGVDIIQLGYDIDDKDLYYAVVVYGKAPDESVIYYAAQFPQAGYWNIPSGKVMRIDAPDADTSAKCQAIADKAIYLMQTRARQVRFSTIGIPHLQRGDFIQVTEASSTISEIYRITDISTSQGPDGYTMELTCYYHAAPEV